MRRRVRTSWCQISTGSGGSMSWAGAANLAGTGLSQTTVEAAIASEVSTLARYVTANAPFWGRVTLGGKIVEYRAWSLPNGQISIGTYYLP